MVQDVAVGPKSVPDSSDKGDSNTEFKLLCLEGHKQCQGQLQYKLKVQWAESCNYEEMVAWEPAAVMKCDVGPMVHQYEQQHAKAAG